MTACSSKKRCLSCSCCSFFLSPCSVATFVRSCSPPGAYQSRVLVQNLSAFSIEYHWASAAHSPRARCLGQGRCHGPLLRAKQSTIRTANINGAICDSCAPQETRATISGRRQRTLWVLSMTSRKHLAPPPQYASWMQKQLHQLAIEGIVIKQAHPRRAEETGRGGAQAPPSISAARGDF